MSTTKAKRTPKIDRSYQDWAVATALKEKRLTIQMPTACHRRGQGILMHDGSVKTVENIKADDLLMGPDSLPRKVLELYRGVGKMTKIVPKKGAPFVVSANHVLTLVRTNETRNKKPFRRLSGSVVDVPLDEWERRSKWFRHVHKLFKVGVEFPNRPELPMDPYFLGVMLGDGEFDGRVAVTTRNTEVRGEVLRQANHFGLYVSQTACGKAIRYFLHKKKGGVSRNRLLDLVRALGLGTATAGNKFIPPVYKTATRQNRLDLLAGLLDTDGNLDRRPYQGNYEYTSKSKKLIEDTAFVARSLGFYAGLFSGYKYDQYGHGGLYWRAHISGGVNEIPTRVAYKKAPEIHHHKNPLRTGFTVRHLPTDEQYFGFMITGDGRYLLDGFTVTHNTGKTFVGIRIIREVLKEHPNFRWLIIVPKEEVLDRWRRDLPESGVFYGKEKNPDQITVSIYNSGVLHPDILSNFDGIIADEVHHISAPVFRQLLELTSKQEFMVGFTATFERRDGLHTYAAQFIPVKFYMSVADAQKYGAQCPLDLYVVRVDLSKEVLDKVKMYDRVIMQGFRRQHSVWMWPKLRMWRELTCLNQRKKILSLADEKVKALVTISQMHKGKRVLVFGGNIDAIDKLAKILRRNGVTAEAYHSKLDPAKAESIRADSFASWGRDFDVLLSVQKLDEGVDVPEAKVAIMLASGRGDLQMIQRTGRIMRPSADSEAAKLYLIIAAETNEESLRTLAIRALKLGKDHVHTFTGQTKLDETIFKQERPERKEDQAGTGEAARA